MVGLLICYVVGAIPQFSWYTQLVCGLLAITAAMLAGSFNQWPAIFAGIEKAAIFPAFLSTIVLLRTAADRRPEVLKARTMFIHLDPTKRDSGVLVGTHLISAVLQVGVFAFLAPILGRDAPTEERRTMCAVALRGTGTMPFWSPFIVGMAVASQYLPTVPLWQIVTLGLSLACVGLLISIIGFDQKPGLHTFFQSLAALVPIAFPIFAAALIVVGTTALTGFSTMEALIISLPVPCLLAVMQAPATNSSEALRETITGIGRLGPEVSVLTCAMMLGVVFDKALPNMGFLEWLTALELPPVAVIFTVILIMNIGGLLCINAIVSGTLMLVIFTNVPTGLNDLILMQTLLVGWGLCSVISLGSLMIATGAAMFKVPATHLITWANISYVFLTSLIMGMVLTGLNALLT